MISTITANTTKLNLLITLLLLLLVLQDIVHGKCRYTMMNSCWEKDPKLRPGFSELVQSISKDLQSMTDYFYVSAFNNQQKTKKE